MKRQATFIAGPCVIESEELLHTVATELKHLADTFDAVFVFKSSFDKANRTSVDSFRGPGLKEGIRMLENVRSSYGLPITTDIHTPEQAAQVADVVDIIQIPAFLCRQTDLLVEAAKTGRVINIKKAQFLSAEDMRYAVDKVLHTGNDKIMLTERGTMFGYNNLVVDFRNIPIMKQLGYPVIMDCTHSVQRPGSMRGATGGNREFIPAMAAAAKAFGASGYFIETHPNPDIALSDGPNMLPLSSLENLVASLL